MLSGDEIRRRGERRLFAGGKELLALDGGVAVAGGGGEGPEVVVLLELGVAGEEHLEAAVPSLAGSGAQDRRVGGLLVGVLDREDLRRAERQ